MNKKELIDLYNTLDFKEECIIVSGGSLVIQNLRDVTEDLDIFIEEETFEKIKEKYNINHSDVNYKGTFNLTDNIECKIVDFKKENYDIVDGIKVESLESVYKFKKGLNRDKDQKDIKKLEEVLNK